MSKNKIGIVTECVCDIPENLLKEYVAETIFFLIEVKSGVFRDTDEITSENILYYMESCDDLPRSVVPPVNDYRRAFEKAFTKNQELIYISMSSAISDGYEKAQQAKTAMGELGKRIHIVDSQHLSTGMGLVVLRAGHLVKEGADVETIVKDLEQYRNEVSTTFITRNTAYLMRNGLVSERLNRLCKAFAIHPVLAMKKGKLQLIGIEIGDYNNAVERYLKKQLRQKNINPEQGSLTHAGVSIRDLQYCRQLIDEKVKFQDFFVVNASASIASNCGPDALGVIFARNHKAASTEL